jgi:DNA-binding NarL/FixJ family response regulator
MEKIKVLVAENNEGIQKAFIAILQEFSRIQVAWGASTRLDLLRILEHYEPDVLLLDMEMPEIDGQGIIKYILYTYPDIKIIGLSFLGEEKYIPELFLAGAHGFLLKDCDPAELERAVYSVIDKNLFISDVILNTFRHRVTATALRYQ